MPRTSFISATRHSFIDPHSFDSKWLKPIHRIDAGSTIRNAIRKKLNGDGKK